MKVRDVIDYLHTIAPNAYQEAYDNSGLLVGSYDDEVRGALVSLDVTEAVIEEAITLGCNLIVSHHPIIFSGVKRLTGNTHVQRCIQKAIKNDINLFAIHTNLDNVYEHGVNTNIAQILGLRNVQILKPKPDMEDKRVGSGIIGELDSMPEMAFLQALKEKMEISCVKYTALLGAEVSKVAVCGGSGGFLLEDAVAQGAHMFITSDYKYHEYFDADGRIVIADIGHFESEQFTTDLLWRLLKEKFSTFAAHYTKVNTNPVRYLV